MTVKKGGTGYGSYEDWAKVFFRGNWADIEYCVWGRHKVGSKLSSYEVLRVFRYRTHGEEGHWLNAAWVKYPNGAQGPVWEDGGLNLYREVEVYGQA